MEINDMLQEIKKPTVRFFWEKEYLENRAVTESFLGGNPYSEDETDISVCTNCNAKFTYVMQLSIPDKDGVNKKLYVLYYCFDCAAKGAECNFQIAVYNNPTEEKYREVAGGVKTAYQERLPISYFVTYELPDYDYLMDVHPDIEEKIFEKYGDNTFKVYSDIQFKFNFQKEDTGNNVFGFPTAIVPSEIPNCPYSNEPMESFLTITSDSRVGLNWSEEEDSVFVILKSPTHAYFQGFVF